jgi:hypothetical protein
VTSLKLPPECRSVSEQSASWSLFSRSHLLSSISSRTLFPQAAKEQALLAAHRAYPDPRSSRAESEVPTPSILFPGRFRSALSHLRISSGNTRRTKTRRSAVAITSQNLLVRGALSEGWGNCRTVCCPTTFSPSRVSESSRRDTLLECEDRPRGPARPAPVGRLLSQKGDTPEREWRHRVEASWQAAAGSWQRAGSEGKWGVDWSIWQLVNWGKTGDE